jgi:glycosyltransferase involved in cell wall biosynthesis
MKRYALIPAYQPDQTLVRFSAQLEHEGFEVILVDDGSDAACAEVFRQAAAAVVLRHEGNRGKGAALRTGLQWLKEHGEGPFVVVTADADGQHKLEDIVRVADAVSEHPDSVVMGCRKFTGRVPLRSRFGNSVTRYVYSFAAGVKVSDTQTGLRGFMSDKLSFMQGVSGERYEYEMNMLLECARESIPFFEVPIETVYIGENETSHFNTITDSFRIYRDILRFSCSSLLSFVVDYIFYTVFILITKNLTASNVAARVISSCFNFSLNKKYVFKNKSKLLPTAVKYFTLAAFILAANTVLLNLLVKYVIGNKFVSKIIVEVLLFMISWAVQRSFVFKNKRGGTDA